MILRFWFYTYIKMDSMIPNKLKRHLETNCSTLVNKTRDYFAR